ncbi:hypothetical protein Emed_002821 [Eimeria media]
MAGAPGGAPACGEKRSSGEDEEGHSTKGETALSNTLDAHVKRSVKTGELNKLEGCAPSHSCPKPEAADAKKIEHQQQQRNTSQREKAPFFYERKKRKRQRLDPCAAILARHMYGDDTAESCLIPEGIVSVYEASLESESTEHSITTLRAPPPVTNVATKNNEDIDEGEETCKKRKRLEEASDTLGEGDDGLNG